MSIMGAVPPVCIPPARVATCVSHRRLDDGVRINIVDGNDDGARLGRVAR